MAKFTFNMAGFFFVLALTSLSVLAQNANLAVTLVDSPDPVAAGQLLTYTLTVTNNGPEPATSVVLDDPIPAGTTFASVAFNGGGGGSGSCTQPAAGDTGSFHCTYATFAAGASSIYTLRVNVSAGTTGTVSNTATVQSATNDPTPANNSVTATTTVLSDADLTVPILDSPDPVAAGQVLTYTLTVTNNGPGIAQNVVLDDPIPAGTTFASATFNGGGGGSGTCTQPAVGGTGSFNCTYATFAAGASSNYTLRVNVSAGTTGTVSNTATVTTTTNDPTPANNSVTSTTAVAPRSLDVDGNASYDALTDGLLIIRYLFGLSGASLINNAVGPGATRTTEAQISNYLADLNPVLDIDGDTQADALTDGLLIIRYLFGLRGASLIAGAVGANATRTTAAAIETQLQSLMP
ncbi:MAG: DUF11 domain-containing protein [Betaproteobacteria bacterium]